MKIKVKTLGCKVNQYEGEAIAEQFARQNHLLSQKKADLYVINTCSVTKTADLKSKKMILRAKKENPKAKIIVCGCLVEANRKFIEKLKVDKIISQKDKPNLVNIALNSKCLNLPQKSIWSLQIKKYPRKRAFLKIQDGCNSFCAFCKIPHLRPKPTSRPKKAVINEIKRLSMHHPEIVLCGINTALYGKDLNPQSKLSDLVESILKLKCLGRLRLSSLQPLFIDNKLINLTSHPKFCPHLHLSFQYGQNSILKAMNKKENVELYLQKVKAIRKVNPQTAISCDIMIGFPGENELTFKKTIDFLKKAKPMRIHIFTFSPREKTPLAKSHLKIKPAVLKKRYQLLSQLEKKFAFDYYKTFLNKELKMVAEERKNGSTSGYTQNYIKTYIKEKLTLGCLVKIKIKKIGKDNQVFAKLA